jgi:hypothetical protein
MSGLNEQRGSPHDSNMPAWPNTTLDSNNQAVDGVQLSPTSQYLGPDQNP